MRVKKLLKNTVIGTQVKINSYDEICEGTAGEIIKNRPELLCEKVEYIKAKDNVLIVETRYGNRNS